MRVNKKNLSKGFLQVQPEDADDLWDLNSIIDKGDTVRASTERKIKLGGSDEKARVIKKKVTLTLTVDKVTFGEELRILGTICDGPDDMPRGVAHSFTINPGDEITINKTQWASYQLARLDESTKTKRALLVVLYDREQALFMHVGGRSVETILTLKGEVTKKDVDEPKKNTLYAQILQHTQELMTRLNPAGVVFGSPAFWQEYMKKLLTPELAKKITFTTISDVEKTAIKELVTRPELASVLKNNRATLEMGFIDQVMTGLAHDAIAYGDADVKKTIIEGNVKAAFISEDRIRHEREQETFAKTEAQLRNVEAAGGIVHIIVSKDAASKLDSLGGFVLKKRW